MYARAEPRGGVAAAPRGPLAKLRLGAEILLAYARVRRLLARQELPRAVELLRGAASAGSAPAPGAESAGLARAVVRALRLLPTDARCLVRALVLLAVLARRGIGAELVIGVLPGPEFAAHAWLEQAGVPLLPVGDAGDGRLVEL